MPRTIPLAGVLGLLAIVIGSIGPWVSYGPNGGVAAGWAWSGPWVILGGTIACLLLLTGSRSRHSETLFLAFLVALVTAGSCVYPLIRPEEAAIGLSDFPLAESLVHREWGLSLAVAGATVLLGATGVSLRHGKWKREESRLRRDEPPRLRTTRMADPSSSPERRSSSA